MKRLLLITILLGCSCWATELKIGQITDTRFDRTQRNNAESTRVLQMAERLADIIVICGDLTYRFDGYDDLSSVLTELSVPVLVVVGNHDRIDAYLAVFGESQWYYDIEEYRLIGIDSFNVDFDWLEMALDSEQIPIIVGHQPLLGGGYKPHLKNAVADQIIEMLTERNGFYLAGHSLQAKLKRIEVNCPHHIGHERATCVSAGVAYQGKFNLVTFVDGQLESVLPIKVEKDLAK